MKFHFFLLTMLCGAHHTFSQTPTLQQVTDNGNTTNDLIVIDPADDAFRGFYVKRLNGAVTSQVGLANNKTAGNITWHPDVTASATTYSLNVGANLPTYYNNGTTETIWRSGNFNPSAYLPLSGGSITGDINIGTTALQKQLNVNGNIKARKVKVTLADWPDYVFDAKYPLMPLPQLEEYLAQHKHLPGIPSAETVKREGLELGENQAVLLKKIEELTLYILEQNKKQEAMEKKMMEMEKRLNAGAL